MDDFALYHLKSVLAELECDIDGEPTMEILSLAEDHFSHDEEMMEELSEIRYELENKIEGG